jgi:hypothetical protein
MAKKRKGCGVRGDFRGLTGARRRERRAVMDSVMAAMWRSQMRSTDGCQR